MPTRTKQQNRALHLFFRHLSETLNEAGLDVRTTLSEDIEHPWNEKLVKELIWRKVQVSMFKKTSTTQLKKHQVSEIYDVINKFLGEKFGLFVSFPSEEDLVKMYEQQAE